MSKPEQKISFSFSSKPKFSSSSSTPQQNFLSEEEQEDDDDESHSQTQYITEFDPSKTLSPKPKILIPPKPNTWNLRTKCNRNQNPPSNPDSPSTPDSLDDPSLKKLREDLKNLPDDRGLDEFNEIPVGSFGSGLLAGYGWSEGRGIGLNSKEDVKVPQYPRRFGTQGLGFNCDLQESSPKQRRVIGYSSDPPVVAPKRVFLGKVVKVVEGRNKGLKGEVVEELGSEFEASTVVLRILNGGELVRVGLDQFVELGSVEEEQWKLQELEIDWEDK
eukprot:TRINITY_DN4618_c0_g1_i1.p1 TRINITY_DN4618_c0_g1~~TRINITY_DN4618_c0_g1_i1.p1  ORF type:complete len:274 (-),score=60.39 TRINITY_DN4618_c0_g1_i1:303-1124(-)